MHLLSFCAFTHGDIPNNKYFKWLSNVFFAEMCTADLSWLTPVSLFLFSCLSGQTCDSSKSLQSPHASVIFQQHPQITTFQLFAKCLWSHIIWFSLYCPSVDGSWWGLRAPSLLFSWEHVPKHHLAVPPSQTHTHAVCHTNCHTWAEYTIFNQFSPFRCCTGSNHLSICSHSIKFHCSLLSAI